MAKHRVSSTIPVSRFGDSRPAHLDPEVPDEFLNREEFEGESRARALGAL
jgi:hypothetical protein